MARPIYPIYPGREDYDRSDPYGGGYNPYAPITRPVTQAPDAGGGNTFNPVPSPPPVPSVGGGVDVGLVARDNAGVTAGEADVAVGQEDADIDPETRRRRPGRVAFMRNARGGAGLKI